MKCGQYPAAHGLIYGNDEKIKNADPDKKCPRHVRMGDVRFKLYLDTLVFICNSLLFKKQIIFFMD